MTIAKTGAAGSLAMLLAACLSACTSGGSQAEGSRGPEPVTSPATRLTTSANPTSSRDPGAQTLSCDNAHVAASPPGPEYEVVLGVVALPTSPSHPAIGIGRPSDVPGPAGFAKDGLAIKTGAAGFQLEVVQVPGVRTAIAWGNYSASHRRVDVPSCPDTGGTGWLFYPGGYFVDKPVCLPLIVRTDDHEQEVHIGVGAECPGQPDREH